MVQGRGNDLGTVRGEGESHDRIAVSLKFFNHPSRLRLPKPHHAVSPPVAKVFPSGEKATLGEVISSRPSAPLAPRELRAERGRLRSVSSRLHLL